MAHFSDWLIFSRHRFRRKRHPSSKKRHLGHSFWSCSRVSANSSILSPLLNSLAPTLLQLLKMSQKSGNSVKTTATKPGKSAKSSKTVVQTDPALTRSALDARRAKHGVAKEKDNGPGRWMYPGMVADWVPTTVKKLNRLSLEEQAAKKKAAKEEKAERKKAKKERRQLVVEMKSAKADNVHDDSPKIDESCKSKESGNDKDETKNDMKDQPQDSMKAARKKKFFVFPPSDTEKSSSDHEEVEEHVEPRSKHRQEFNHIDDLSPVASDEEVNCEVPENTVQVKKSGSDKSQMVAKSSSSTPRH
ncbi:unnamed protein product [Caenorhabditis angaria]|uniref:Uncharacterized protein n=1 Tax=Caenorhabditis angaria TaxID=860376 RepID=A0A9P1NCQ5_9PELO|nr:unnamed protein product [Caenorhabditis angaria]